MVSFHCDACTDVVKKPKLAHHYAQCRKSFTCIDCSKTFKDPTEWKSHTSCVSEAEKYQKSLYTGPKQGRQTNPTPKTMNAPGKYHQSPGTQSAWSRHQYTRNCASGANSTPLGSPLRMSSVDSLVVEPPLSSAKAASATESGKDKKRDSGAVVNHTPNGAEPKENKRKRKRDTPREHNVNDATTDEQPMDKKVKNRKREKREEARLKQGVTSEENTAPPETVASLVGDDTKDEKKSKRKRKEKREEGAAAEPEPLLAQTNGAEKKRNIKKDKDAKSGVDQGSGEQRQGEDGREKKRKKKRSEVGEIT